MKQHRSKGITILIWIILLLSMAAFFMVAHHIYRLWAPYREGEQAYEALQSKVVEALDAEQLQDGSRKNERTINFTELQMNNSDASAWLYCPDTPIDYPVMWAESYSKYLRTLPDGSYSLYGSLFVDSRYERDFSGEMNIIYGHNIKNQAMFGTLPLYAQQNYYDEHPAMELYTEQQSYTVELLYGAGISAGLWEQNDFFAETNLEALLQYAKQNSTFQSSAQIHEQAALVILMTCGYDYDDARYFVIGQLIPEG